MPRRTKEQLRKDRNEKRISDMIQNVGRIGKVGHVKVKQVVADVVAVITLHPSVTNAEKHIKAAKLNIVDTWLKSFAMIV